jgi:hypothetical protein
MLASYICLYTKDTVLIKGFFGCSKRLGVLHAFFGFSNQFPQCEQSPPPHEPQDGSDMPETDLPPLSAKKTEILRFMSSPPHLMHAVATSA